jgi:hypothetical protein
MNCRRGSDKQLTSESYLGQYLMKYTFWLSLLFILQPNDNLDLFSSYKKPIVRDSSGDIVPPSRFNGYPDVYFNWLETPKDLDGKDLILKISTFLYKYLITAEQFVIEPSGIAYARVKGVLSTRGDGTSQPLNKGSLEKLDALLAKVPQSAISPPLDRLICISYRNPNNHEKWMVCTFDMKTLPDSIDKILQISGYYSLTEHGRRLAKAARRSK